MRTIYHGSEKIIERPQFGVGRIDNDYGPGFYCTEDIELAKEWAASSKQGGFVNIYEINEDGAVCMKLLEEDTIPPDNYDSFESSQLILNWMALLVANRKIRISSPVEKRGREYLLSRFLPEIGKYDYLVGYRADDSYFSYARAFLSNTLTIGQLSAAMHLGNLGLQYVIRSRRMFERVHFLGAVPVDGSIYYPKRMERDHLARRQFQEMLEDVDKNGLYLSDLMRKESMI